MPQESQRKEEKHYYGRQITKIEPEEILTEAIQSPKRGRTEKASRVREAVR